MRALPTGPWEAAPPGLAAAPADADWELRNATISHVFTHFRLTCALAVARDGAHETAGEWWPIDRLDEAGLPTLRSEEHTSELQSLIRISYAVFCLKKKNRQSKHRS